MIAPDEPQQSIQVSVSGDQAVGVYANFVVISHTDTEVVLDFAVRLPGIEQPVVRSRVVMSPVQAKRFHAALAHNLSIYEKQFGEISDPGSQNQA